MAIKQRALMKLDMTKKHVLHVMRTKRKVAWGEVYRDLTEARDLYREGLPRSGYAAYGEIYDGLILAVQKVMEGEEENFQEEALALCQELLEYLEGETAKETRFKKEIFFLPYKMSMFDSLESVWKAADEDKEHCIAYVMPIPYADRNPDQTVAAWHCERDQFPKDVPTLDWQQVDLKAWHPDIIVYHSPYDNCNAVTSVDERYYSRNLRYCADRLVYIPYFVLDEIEPGNEAAEESIAHFITAPGVLNADLVVVQSEKMRQVYINVLSRHTNQGEEYWQTHVSGAGSPKIEKVLTSKKEDFEMPEKWRKLVDGRKVILYNTSLSAMLQNSDKVCNKLRYVFDVFRNRNDVVLWWRPHPLMKATFHSMRSQFEEEYLSLEKQYIDEGWGIYDDSPDLHRAICWSDAYYGDGSSVVTLYQQVNKPIMIQKLWEATPGFMIGFVAVEGQDIWCIGTSGLWQGIFRIDLEKDTLHYIDEIPSEKKYLFEYQALGLIDNKIVMPPYFSENGFLEYNVLERKFSSKNIGKEIPREYNKKVACSNVITYKRSLFFLANQSKKIIEYCADMDRYVIHEELRHILPDGLSEDELSVGRHCYQLVGNVLFFVFSDTNLLVELNLDMFQGKCYEIPFIKKAWNLHIHRNKVYIIPSGSDPFVYLDLSNGETKVLPNINKDENVMGWYGLVSLADKCVTIPYRIPAMYSATERWGEREEEISRDWIGEIIHGVVMFDCVTNPGDDGRCFAYNNCTKHFIEVSQEGNFTVHKLAMSSMDWDMVRERIWKATNKHSENEVLTIHDLLHFLSRNTESVREKMQVERFDPSIYDILFKEENT